MTAIVDLDTLATFWFLHELPKTRASIEKREVELGGSRVITLDVRCRPYPADLSTDIVVPRPPAIRSRSHGMAWALGSQDTGPPDLLSNTHYRIHSYTSACLAHLLRQQWTIPHIIFVSWVVVLIRRQYFPAQSGDRRLPIVEKVNDFTLNEPQRRRLTRRLSDPEATLGRRAAPSSLYQRPNLPPNPSVVTSTSNWTNHPSVSHLIESIHPQSPQSPHKRAEGSTIRDPQKLQQIEELEYRSLTALLWILPCYYFGLQMLGFAILAPYLSLRRWRDVLLPPQQHRPIPAVWFALFLTISALTNTGMTLVDQSMIPFQQAYPMLLCLGALILAGNTCFPIFLRFTIWATASCLPTTSRLHQTLRFLLKNPRRCFIYLFPSHQTWFLLGVVCVMMFADWFFFLVLDLRNQLSDLPLGVRCIVGFFQGVALRTAGFSVVPLALVAPAVKVLYAGMMYISAYPVAMSVRSTNIYEEQSLGSEVGLPEVSTKEYLRAAETKREAWSRYLAVHVRSQLAFDMWWLVLALFLVCIVETTMELISVSVKSALCLSGFCYLHKLSRRLAGPTPPPRPDASEDALAQVSYGEVKMRLRNGIPMEMTSKGYVVIGGSGFLGSHIVELLLLRGETKIRIIGRQQPPPELSSRLGVTWLKADITNAQEIKDAILAPFPSGEQAQVIYHTAATIRFFERAAYTWDYSYKTNVLGVRNVLEAAKELPAATVIYTSSAAVSIPTVKYLRLEPWNEPRISDATPDPPMPRNCYYRSKRLAEGLVKEANESSTIRTGILRPGYAILGPKDRKLTTVLSLPVVPVWDANWGSRDICVWDCAAAHLCYERALEQNPNEVAGKSFLISGEDVVWSMRDIRNAVKFFARPRKSCKLRHIPPLTIYIVAHLIEAFLYLRYHILQLVCHILGYNTPALRPKWMGDASLLQPSMLDYFQNVYLDDSRARNLLGYRPQWSLAQTIKYTVEKLVAIDPREVRDGLRSGDP
ncbi:hypothetical protein ONZ45_g9333 [Pleurotus djamor]|nr:hypothetical protein ONZ45_g9333 [Pleurotus djamor]